MRSLTLKLLLSVLAALLFEAVLGMVLVRRATHQEFERFIQQEALDDFVERCLEHYQTTGSWDGVRPALRPRPPRPGDMPPPRPKRPRQRVRTRQDPPPIEPNSGHPPPPFALADADGVIVIPASGYRLREVVDNDRGTPIEWNGEHIGTVLVTANSGRPGPAEQRYMERADQALLGASLVAVTVAAFFAFFAASSYTKPLRQLTEASHAMKRGVFQQEVPVTSDDELGALTLAFNQMSADLARAQKARRQMTADIAHDLRTPLTVITGYLEAMCDGTLPPTSERLNTVRREAEQLHRLVADLRTLSLADAGELTLAREPVQLHALIDQTVKAFEQRAAAKGIELTVVAPENLPVLELDPERMARVLANLLANGLHHTPRDGAVVLSATESSGDIEISVTDTGPGIAPENLPHVFDRFYRADASRTDDDGHSGHSGLGLAIVKSIVETHGGSVSVESDPGKGSSFKLRFPRPS